LSELPPEDEDAEREDAAEEPEVAPDDIELPAEPSPETHGHAAPAGVPPLLAWIGRFHPTTVHFPIALLIAAALGELLVLRRGGSQFEHAVRFCVWLGAIGAVVAAALGWLFAGFAWVDDEWLMTTHRWCGTGAAAWAVGILVSCERTYRGRGARGIFRFALFAGALLVGVTGFWGGSLLYGLDHFAW
jgi:uncharacterized membrane protein